MMIDVVVPQIGEAVSELLLSEWYKREGDTVRKGDPLFSIDSEKSVIDVEAVEDGVLAEIIHGDGSSVMPTQVVARIRTVSAKGEPDGTGPIGVPATATSSEGADGGVVTPYREAGVIIPSSAVTPTRASGSRVLASPKARALANREGIDITHLVGSGVRGMLISSDLAAREHPEELR